MEIQCIPRGDVLGRFLALRLGGLDPAHYELMTHDQSGQALPTSLRLAIVTTAYLRHEIAKRFHQGFGLLLNETYGIIVPGHFGSVPALAGFIRQKRAVSEDN